MPNLDVYKKMLHGAKTNGQVHKIQSDMVMESTWYNDINAKTAWFYDQDHDSEFDIADDLHPEKSKTKIPVEIKLFEVEYNSLSKDEQPFHLQFKPSYECNIPYYEEKFKKNLGAIFPIGLFLDYPDDDGIYHRYLVVGQYRHYSNQFPTYLVLPCDYKMQWIYKNRKFESWCVLRSQSSYNSGVWTDYKVTQPENQKIAWFSYNDITKTIFYDQRLVISQDRDIPVVWKVSKVEDMNVKGIARYTCAQDAWDEHKDYKEYDDDGNLIGMWADYYENQVSPTAPSEQELNIYCKITYKGVQNNQFRVNGSARTFVVKFYKGEEEIPYQRGNWSFIMDDKQIDKLFLVEYQDDDTTKIKYTGPDGYIGRNVQLTYTSITGVSSSIKMVIMGN